MPDKYFDALKRYYELTKWEMYQDNPDYIKETIHSDYWWAKSHNDESKFGLYILIAISSLTIIISVIVILILFKCKKTDDETEDNETKEEDLEP